MMRILYHFGQKMVSKGVIKVSVKNERCNHEIDNDRQSEYKEIEKNETVKLERHQMNSYSIDRNIDTLLKWKKKGKLRIPDFQREYVWGYSDSVKFVDTILIGLPAPNIFVFKTLEENDEVYTLIDGLQRITTVENFRAGKWSQKGKKTRDFKINLKSSFWYGEMYQYLTDNDRDAFDDYQFVMTVFEMNSNKLNTQSAMYSLFERINTGAEELSAQEIRNAVYNGCALQDIKQLSKKTCYAELIAKDNSTNKRAYDLEILCRVFSYYYVWNRLTQDKTTLLDNIDYIDKTKISNNITTSKIDMINAVIKMANDNAIEYKDKLLKIETALIHIKSALGADAFYGKRRGKSVIGNKIHELFTEALIISVIINHNNIKISLNDFNEKKLKLMETDDFYEYFVQKSTSKENIMKRVEIMSKLINGKYE